MADCSNPLGILADPLGCAAQLGGQVVGAATDSAIQSAANAMYDAFGRVIKLLFTGWMGIPNPDLAASAALTAIQKWTLPLAAFALTIGLIITGLKLAWAARFDDTGRTAMKGILQTVIVVGAGGALMAAVLDAADSMANDVLNGGFNGVNVGQRAIELAASTNAVPVLGPGLAFIAFLLALLGTLGQAALMLLRGPVLIILCGIWPTTAAASLAKHGDTWFKRITGWLLSWALYKLVAAIVYATAFMMIGTSADLAGLLSGLLLLGLAVLALPALIRLITPAVAAVPTGGGTAATLSETAGAIGASGAVQAMSSGGAAAGATQKVGEVTAFSGPTGAAAATGGSAGAATTGAAAASGVGAGLAAVQHAGKAASGAAQRATHNEPERTPV